MNKEVSDQFAAVVAVIVQNITWKGRNLQMIIRAGNQGRLGPALDQALDSVVPPPPLIIDRSLPVHELGPKWPVWLGPADGNGLEGEPDVDPRAGAVTTFDASKVRFLSGLVEGEPSITGEEKLKRLRIGTDIQIDAQTLWSWYTEKGQVTLRWLHDNHGVNWIEELGTVLRRPRGGRYSLILYRQGVGGWVWRYSWLAYGRDTGNPAVGLASA